MTPRQREKRRRNRQASEPENKAASDTPTPVVLTSSTQAVVNEDPTNPANQAATDQGKQKEHAPGNRIERPLARLWFWALGESRSERIESLQALFNGGLFIFTIIATFVAGYGGCIAKRQLDSMDAQNNLMTAQLRPWINIKATVPIKPETGLQFNVQLEFKNSGATPGTIIANISQLVYFLPGIKTKDEDDRDVGILEKNGIDREVVFEQWFLDEMDADANKDIIGAFVVPPGDPVLYGVSRMELLDEITRQEIEESKLFVVLIAVIRYTDAISNPSGVMHTTQYCGIYNPIKGEFSRIDKYNQMY